MRKRLKDGTYQENICRHTKTSMKLITGLGRTDSREQSNETCFVLKPRISLIEIEFCLLYDCNSCQRVNGICLVTF